MSQRKLSGLMRTGLLMLAGGLILHNWIHRPYTEFAGGFLIGISTVFMIAGLVIQSRKTS